MLGCCSNNSHNRVYADWKVRENHIKITFSLQSQGKSGNWKKMLYLVKESQGKFVVQILEMKGGTYCHLEIKFLSGSITFLFLGCRYMVMGCNIS